MQAFATLAYHLAGFALGHLRSRSPGAAAVLVDEFDPDVSRRIGRPHAPSDLGAVFTLDHCNIVLALQIKPELCAVSKIAAEPHRCICSDRPAPVEYVGDAA